MLRAAKIEDAKLIVSIRKAAILAQPETFWTRKQLESAANCYGIDYIIANFSAHNCSIYDDKAFVAWKDNYLASLFILPEAQRNRLGEKLLTHAENEMKKNHAEAWLYAHPYAERFYERQGYLRLAETDSPFGVPLNKYLKQFINLSS